MTLSVYHRSTLVEITTLFPICGGNPEDIIIDEFENIYCGVGNGDTIKIADESRNVSVVTNMGGRPLGLDWLSDGRLLIYDSDLGLLALNLLTNK